MYLPKAVAVIISLHRVVYLRLAIRSFHLLALWRVFDEAAIRLVLILLCSTFLGRHPGSPWAIGLFESDG